MEPIEKAMYVIYVALCHHVYGKRNYDICLLEFPISKYEAIKCPLRLCCVFSSFCIKKIPLMSSESSKGVSIGPSVSSLMVVNKPVIII